MGSVQSSAEAGKPIRFSLSVPTILVVADGLGGHRGGEVASTSTVTYLLDRVHGMRDAAGVSQVLTEVNGRLHERMRLDQSLLGMGTTVAGVLIGDGSCTVFNVGDSRVYRIVDGYLGQLSRDDRPPRMPGQPDDAETRMVTQCLGGLRSDQGIDPHRYELTFAAGDRFLLCSDGLLEALPTSRITELLNTQGRQAVPWMLSEALGAGAPDNVSIIDALVLS